MHHRHPLRALAAVLLGLAGLLPTASTAAAAVPANDDIGGASVLGPVPFHLEQDTTEATTSAEEAALNDFCGAPALANGVWFTATAAADANVVADVTDSDFSAGILVLSGEPGALVPLTCAPGTVSGPVTAGETIYLLVFGDGVTDATSGHLVLDTYLAPVPPSVTVTINPRGSVDKFGVVHISGTVSCSSEAPPGALLDISGSVRQRVGRGFVDGDFFVEQLLPCDGVARPWTADVFGDGKFAGGKAATIAFGFACDSGTCNGGYVEGTVQLSRNGK